MNRVKIAGFTIVELMIATMVFSTILILISSGLIQVSRLYYKGITTSRTQQTTRNIMDTVSRSIQFSGGSVSAVPDCGGVPTNPCYFCINNDRYTYQINKQLVDGSPGADQQNHVFIKDTTAACSGPANLVTPPSGSEELMGTNMRLVNFNLSKSAAPPFVYNLTLRIIAGDSDLLCSPAAGDCSSTTTSTNLTNSDITCKMIGGSQFCAAAQLDTTIEKRI